MGTQTEGFKFYSERSKARRALREVYGIADTDVEAFLTKQEGKHGFTLSDGAPVRNLQPNGSAMLEALGAPAALVEAVEKIEDESSAASAFGAFAVSQLTASSNMQPAAASKPAPAAQRTEGLRIEKDRKQVNGVKERSRGGLCRLVWDTLDSMCSHDPQSQLTNVPTVADIKKHAAEKGWNVNNASIEYYQWRKFHGITGRGKKQI